MYISFYLDEEFYAGEVSCKEIANKMHYDVDLGRYHQFSIVMGDQARWISDDHVNPKLIDCVGSEIERHDLLFKEEPLHPKHYRSAIN